MSLRSIIRHTINDWALWRLRRSLRRAEPRFAALDAREADLRARHKAGAKSIAAERKALMTARLQLELGR